MAEHLTVYLEAGAKRVFAGALEWPGWCRAAKTEAEALEALADYRDRYAAALAREPSAPALPERLPFEVVERLAGHSGTDFGAPSHAPAADDRPMDEAALARSLAVLRACWTTFDDLLEASAGHQLRLGPRGGGRDQRRILAHVVEADEAYLAQLGARPPKAGGADPVARLLPLREAVTAALTACARGLPQRNPSATRRPWTPRYYVRRAAWHVLDHAWEVEDRVT